MCTQVLTQANTYLCTLTLTQALANLPHPRETTETDTSAQSCEGEAESWVVCTKAICQGSSSQDMGQAIAESQLHHRRAGYCWVSNLTWGLVSFPQK